MGIKMPQKYRCQCMSSFDISIKNIRIAIASNHLTVLTYFALHADFTNSAHLSNSCRKLLGLSPMELLNQSKPLEIILAEGLL